MDKYYIAQLNLNSREKIWPLNQYGFFDNPADAYSALTNRPDVVEESAGFVRDRRNEDIQYMVLQMTPFVYDAFFGESIYDVYFINNYGQLTLAKVKSRIMLTEFDFSDDIINCDLRAQLEASDIVAITLENTVEVKEVTFNGAR